MANRKECLDWTMSCVGVAQDIDGAYGAQCVDLIMAYMQKFWGQRARGNAIDYMSNELPEGFKRYKKGEATMEPADIAIWKWSDSDIYGHIGIVTKVDGNQITSVEQNVDGGNGGPARVRTRSNECLVGFIKPPFSDDNYNVNPGNNNYKMIHQEWHFTVTVATLNVRNKPSLSGDIVAKYTNGGVINYDSYCVNDGYVWISYISYSGERRYVATGTWDGSKNNSEFGHFR